MSSTSTETVLSGRELSKTYGNMFTRGNIHALDKASFEVRRGEICGLVGPNGAGKSTMLKLIMGIEPKSGGSIDMNGLDPRTALGYVPERPTFLEDLSAYYNVLYIARLNNVPDPEGTSRKLIDEFGLKGRGDDPVSSYSKGMKQRLAIARAVVHQPTVLLMDEPFSGLDPGMMIELRGLLKGLKSKGMAMLLSSHELNEINQLCDSILFIKSGRILKKEGFGPSEERMTMQLVLASPNAGVVDALARWGQGTVSPDGMIITKEVARDEVPDIVAAAVNAGGRVMEYRTAQRKAEDMYAEIYLQEAKA
ncbi:ABC transporter ATP-binding protein [Methanomassiliicoccus luminyensis]|uniref:ABC transporter ATP-binding protein n=1 Tax=Methanomassiliicoccus luminyensis TaxID=1080712 RepID=UPI000382C9EA|nr:ABC transporter ATP-binding protein [Methanomassiliicoccus luminyensis]